MCKVTSVKCKVCKDLTSMSATHDPVWLEGNKFP